VSDAPPSPEFLALQAALANRYRLERELGAGGMATVYLAHDTKHERRVALKVLRPELAVVIGAQRFLQEIRTTAHLQHPHILGLIDSGETEHLLWYVMPFVEGESLRDRLDREKQLPVSDAVRLAIEVASALDYAHRHGVIHRDIKPENILLHDGRALVADFGIALAATNAGASRMTETGMSLGTPQYQSPEQAMGEREITARSDVYSLGCVLYEMLVGEPPFSGPTAQSIAAKVITSEPAALTAQRKTIPASVEAAVLQALEKLPADRFGSAAEFSAALQNASFIPDAARSTAARRRHFRTPPWLPWTLTVGALGVLLFVRLRPPPPPPPPTRPALRHPPAGQRRVGGRVRQWNRALARRHAARLHRPGFECPAVGVPARHGSARPRPNSRERERRQSILLAGRSLGRLHRAGNREGPGHRGAAGAHLPLRCGWLCQRNVAGEQRRRRRRRDSARPQTVLRDG
jgi:serine/threonine-protein kinase